MTDAPLRPTKIMPLAAATAQRDQWQRESRRVVVVHGLFDLLDSGHLQRLSRARAEGDVLIVSLRPDIDPAWGRRRATLDQNVRALTLASLPFVDLVVPATAWSALGSIQALRPDVFAQGVDGIRLSSEREEDGTERSAVGNGGGKLIVLDEAEIQGSADRVAESTPGEADAFLRGFRSRYSAKDVIGTLKDLRGLKVLVVGDTIIDEYHFCRPYGMPQKSPVIAAQFLQSEAHAGGILAVANHLAGFCDTVHLLTCLGAADTREDFVRSHLLPNVRADLFVRPDGPTTVKRRYIRKFMARNLFEVSFFNDAPLPTDIDIQICRRLSTLIDQHDVVVVADFGQGAVSANMVEVLCRRSKFLAVNSQLNSINYGFNVITRYPRVDYVCIDLQELQMACRDRQRPAAELASSVAHDLSAEYLTVTLGHLGSLTHRRGKPPAAVPVLSRNVVDTIGAGDAFLSITAPCAQAGIETELLGFIGNAVGALAVRFIGNQQSITPEALFDFVENILG